MQTKVLIVDDDYSVSASLALVLKQAGYAPLTAANPAEALSVISSQPVDLVLQDMNFSRQTTGDEGLMLLSGMVFGLFLIFFGLTNSLTPAFIYLLFVGGGNSLYITLTNTLLMSNTPQELMGRVMSLFMMTFGLMPLGVLPASALAEIFGAPPTVIVGGALLSIFLLIVSITKPSIRRL